LYCSIVVNVKFIKIKCQIYDMVVSTILLIHVYIFFHARCLMLTSRRYKKSRRCKDACFTAIAWLFGFHIIYHVNISTFFVQNFEQLKIIFVIYRSLKTLQNAVEYLHNKSEKKRWQKNSNVSCSVIHYGEHFVLGVACVYMNPYTPDSV